MRMAVILAARGRANDFGHFFRWLPRSATTASERLVLSHRQAGFKVRAILSVDGYFVGLRVVGVFEVAVALEDVEGVLDAVRDADFADGLELRHLFQPHVEPHPVAVFETVQELLERAAADRDQPLGPEVFVRIVGPSERQPSVVSDTFSLGLSVTCRCGASCGVTRTLPRSRAVEKMPCCSSALTLKRVPSTSTRQA